MKAEIVAVGTELLLGQITNKNATFLSEQLNTAGLPVYYHTVVGDNRERLRSVLKVAADRSDTVLLTGGLGPTQDDVTKEVVAQLTNRSLVTDRESMDRIQRYFEQRGLPMTENNKRQALVVEGAHIFPNHNGMAPGMAVEEDGVRYLLFPGPPCELQPMFVQLALPYLERFLPGKRTVFSKVLRFCGIGESLLETELKDLIDGQTNPTIAPLAKEGEVTLRLTSFAADKTEALSQMQHVIQQIQSKVGRFQYGWDDESLPEVLLRRLAQDGKTIACAESCTGGGISTLLSQVSGAGQSFRGSIICYHTDVKKDLGVPEQTISRSGVVSAACAEELAAAVADKLGADIGLSVTGVAGPSSQEDKPIGLIYIGLYMDGHNTSFEARLGGTRTTIQLRASKLALFHAIRCLRGKSLPASEASYSNVTE